MIDLTEDDADLGLGLAERLKAKHNPPAGTRGANLSDKENIAAKPSATKDSDSDDELDVYLARRAGSGSTQQTSKLFNQPLAGSKPAVPDTVPSRAAAYTAAAPATAAAGRTSAATGSALQQQASAGQAARSGSGQAAKPPARASTSSRRRAIDSDEDSDVDDLEARPQKRSKKPPSEAQLAREAERQRKKDEKEAAAQEKAREKARKQAAKAAEAQLKAEKQAQRQQSAMIHKVLKGEMWLCQMQVVTCPSYSGMPFLAALDTHLNLMALGTNGIKLQLTDSAQPLPLAASGFKSMLFRMRDLQGTVARQKQVQEIRASQASQADEIEQMLAEAADAGDASTLEDVPFVLVLFDEPSKFAAELQDGCCQRLLQLAAQHHPGCSLGIWVHNFEQWCMREEARNGRAGKRDFSKARLMKLMARMTLTCPGVQLKDMDSGQFGDRFYTLVRTLGQQPYKDQEGYLDAVAGDRSTRTGLEDLGDAHKASAKALSKVQQLSCKEAAAVVQSFGSLGGLMSHLSNSSLSQQQREAQVANLKPEGAKKRIGPAKVSRMVQLLMSTDPDEVIEFGSWEEEQQG